MKRSSLATAPIVAAFFLGLLVTLSCLTTALAQETSVTRLRDVQRIYVGDMGKSDDAERFRLLLGDELMKRKFTVVDKEELADAVLTGIFSLESKLDHSIGRATVRLKSAGTVIWSGDFQPKFKLTGSSDKTKRRAQDVAEALEKAKKKDQ